MSLLVSLLLQFAVLAKNNYQGAGFSFHYPDAWSVLKSESDWQGDNVILGAGGLDADGLPHEGLMVSLVTERKKLRVADPSGQVLRVKRKLAFDEIVRRVRRGQQRNHPDVTQLKGTEGRWTVKGRMAIYKDWLKAGREGGLRGRDVFIDDPQGVIVLSFVAPESDFEEKVPILWQILASLEFAGS